VPPAGAGHAGSRGAERLRAVRPSVSPLPPTSAPVRPPGVGPVRRGCRWTGRAPAPTASGPRGHRP